MSEMPDGWPSESRRAELRLSPLPPLALQILEHEQAVPRLVAHLTLVHDVAIRLVAAVSKAWPSVSFDKESVLFGAATHDIGKALRPPV